MIPFVVEAALALAAEDINSQLGPVSVKVVGTNYEADRALAGLRQEAEAIVRALKYGPAGCRGVATGIAHDLYRPAGADFFAQCNEEIPIIIQLESVRAFENLEAIVSVPGVDVAWVGHYDLTVSMGIPAQFDHPRLLQAMDHLVAACARHGVAPGYLPPTPESAAHWISKGFRMISLGSDIGVFLDGMRRFRAFVTREGEKK